MEEKQEDQNLADAGWDVANFPKPLSNGEYETELNRILEECEASKDVVLEREDENEAANITFGGSNYIPKDLDTMIMLNALFLSMKMIRKNRSRNQRKKHWQLSLLNMFL